jgi:hypothetical protein
LPGTTAVDPLGLEKCIKDALSLWDYTCRNTLSLPQSWIENALKTPCAQLIDCYTKYYDPPDEGVSPGYWKVGR